MAKHARLRSTRSSRSTRFTRGAVAVLLAISGVGATAALLPVAAQAAPGDAFDPNTSMVFIGQESPTTLYTAVQGQGIVTFVPQGTSDRKYNAIGYNTVDNYLYGIRGDNGFTNTLQRIGQNGVVVGLGVVAGLPVTAANNGYNQGAFGSGATAQTLYVRDILNPGKMWAVNVTTLTATQITLSSPVPNVSDIVWKDGYLWGQHSDGRMYRIDPTTGSVASWATGIPQLAAIFGAQWLYGNGNIGLSANLTGTVYQLAITNPTSATPSFTLLSTLPGPRSDNNDGASSPGLDVDLGIVKAGPTSYVPGQSVSYNLTVTNYGPGISTGSVVRDVLPAQLSSASTSTAGCSIASGTLSCALGELAVGDSTTITVNATANLSGSNLTNTASVIGNERDPNSANDTSTSTATANNNPQLSLAKSATPSDPADFVEGQTVTYSFLVSNTGNVPMTGITVNETSFTGHGAMSAVNCPVTTLAPNASVRCTATYVISSDDVDAGGIENTATATGTPPSGPAVTTQPSSVAIPVPAGPAVTIEKSVSPSTASKAGDSVTYSFLVTNSGNVTLDPVAVNEGSFSGTGTMSAIVCPTTSLLSSVSTTCTATYTLTQEDVNAGVVTNVATATGTPPSGPAVTSAPSMATVTIDAAPSLTMVKSATPTTANLADDNIAYSFLVTNTGNVTLHDVTVTEGAFTGTGTMSAVSCPAMTLAPLGTMTCTANYQLTQDDVDAGGIQNTATATGTPPNGGPVDSPPSTVPVTVTPAPALTLNKLAAPDDIASFSDGQQIVYSFLLTNTGNVTLHDVDVNEGTFTGTGTLSAVACPSTTLAPTVTMTCTAEYTLTSADIDAGSVTNTATGVGTPPTGTSVTTPPSDVTLTGESLPAIALVKTASPQSATTAGNTIAYSFLVTNTGNVTVHDVSVAEGTFTGTGTMSAVSCPATTLAAKASMNCTAQYVLTQADIANGSVKNTATAIGTPPTGGPVSSSPSTATVQIAAAKPAALAGTGATVAWGAVALAGGMILFGGMLLFRRREAR